MPQDVVNAADQIAPTISVAVKVRAKLKGIVFNCKVSLTIFFLGQSEEAEIVDALGRTLRQADGDALLTEDGQKVPTTARYRSHNSQLF